MGIAAICFLFIAFAFGNDAPLEKDELKPAVFAKNESNATDFDEAFIADDGEERDLEEDTEFELLEENDVVNAVDVEGVDVTNATGEEVFAKNESAPTEFVEEEKDVEGKLSKNDTSDHKAVMSEEEEIASFGEEEEEEEEEEDLVEVEDDVEEEE